MLIALVVFGAVLVWNRRHGMTRNCRWREDRAGSKGALIKYNCVTCGAEAFRSTGKPDTCLSRLNKPGL
nr:hypothetical protein [Sulfitobacter aestuariivivens]